MMKITVLAALAAALMSAAACAPKATNAAANQAQASAALPPVQDPAAECASYGLKPGTDDYKSCVTSLADANAAVTSSDPAAMRSQIEADAAKQRAQMQAEADQDRAAMKQQMAQDEAAAGNATSGCKTTRDANNNVSTVCP